MSKFDDIRPFYDEEVNDALQSVSKHPMMKALMRFTFPDRDDSFWLEKLENVHSIYDFQSKVIYQTVLQIFRKKFGRIKYFGL